MGDNKSVTKIGKKVYPTREKAEADVKRLCHLTSKNLVLNMLLLHRFPDAIIAAW